MREPIEERLTVTLPAGSFTISAKLRRSSKRDWIVLLHGWGGVKEGFDSIFDLPSLQAYSLCALDLIGFGASDKPHTFSYDLATQAAVVAQVIELLDMRSVTIVGHSMGGGVGLLCTQKVRSRLQLFVSIEGNLIATDTSPMTRKLASQPYMVFRLLSFPLMRRALRVTHRLDYQVWLTWFTHADPWAVYKSAQSLAAWSDSEKLLPMFLNLSQKAYIYGELSERVPYIVPHLPEDDTYCITNSQHFPMVDNPKGLYETLVRVITASSGATMK